MSASPDERIPQPSFTPNRLPLRPPSSRTIREPMIPANRELLKQLRDSVEAIDFPTLDAARANGQQYAAALAASPAAGPLPVRIPGATLPVASLGPSPLFDATASAHYGTGPQLAAIPTPAPAPRWPEGVVRGFLIAGLWDAACWYGGLDPESCADCQHELCGFHAPRQMKALEYEDLHDFAAASLSDAAAINAIAISIRTGRADLSDIAGRGSPLEALLLVRLQQTLESSPGAWRQTAPEDAATSAQCGIEGVTQ